MQDKSQRGRQSYFGCTLSEDAGVLRLRYRWCGKQRSKSLGLRDTAAHRAALEPLRQLVGEAVARGKDPAPLIAECLRPAVAPAPAVPLRETVATYYAGWIARQVTPLVRKAQARDYRRHLEGYVLPILGRIPLDDLTASDVDGLKTELLTNGRPRLPAVPQRRRGTPSQYRPLSVKTVRNVIVGSLRALLRQARKDGVLTRERFADLVDLQWPKREEPKPDPFTGDERTHILRWFRERRFRLPSGGTPPRYDLRCHPAYHACLHVLFWTGMRPSEAAGLQWQDVDLRRGTIDVRRSRHLWEYGAPKTASARRTVQLFPETIALLRALQPLHVSPTAPVFPNTRGEPIEPNSLLSHWYDGQRALGIRVRGLYATKDTFVTTALEAGVRIAWLEQQTGVAYATLRRHYGTWMPSDGEAELARFQALDPGLFVAGIVPDREVIVPGAKLTIRERECERGDLNPHGCLAHRILNPARLPIPPLSQEDSRS
jgi:integrase